MGLAALQMVSGYTMVRQYAGSSFFNKWDFYGAWDNLTLGWLFLEHSAFSLIGITGDVWWLDKANATAQGLTYVNDDGNAVIKVDDTSYVPFNEKRNAVRITSKDSYNYGSLLIFDVIHLPYGCSVSANFFMITRFSLTLSKVWPAIWTKGML